MKKLIIILLGVLIVGGTLYYFTSKNTQKSPQKEEINYKEKLENVLNSKTQFIDEKNNEILFKEYKIQDKNVYAKEYTFVDLDKDGILELVVLTTSDYGAYLVFHYEEDKIYGYIIGIRSFESLKQDGSFIGSNGANSQIYCTISFNKEKYVIYTNAVNDGTNKIYKINDKDVTKEVIDKYVLEFENKENAKYNLISYKLI